MSTTCSVICLDCREYAPAVGDGGYLGSASLELGVQEVPSWGTMPTFRTLYEPLVAIGVRPHELEVFWDWLQHHGRHRLHMSAEGMDEDPPEVGEIWAQPDARARANARVRKEKADRSTALSEGTFCMAQYATSCSNCRAELISPDTELLRAFEPFPLNAVDITAFLDHWTPVIDGKTEGVWRLLTSTLDPNEPYLQELASFLRTHGDHGVIAHLANQGVV